MRYRITSRLGALGARPGEYVERVLSPAQERRLIEAGHITPAPKKNRPRRAVIIVKEKDNGAEEASS